MSFTTAVRRRKIFSRGKSCSVVTYGASGSGKSHTMIGDVFRSCLQLDQNQMSSQPIDKEDKQKTSPTKTPKRTLTKFRAKRTSAYQVSSPAQNHSVQTPGRIKQNETTAKKSPHIDRDTSILLKKLSQDPKIGLLPRFIYSIFDRIKKKKRNEISLTCSYMNIQHEEVFDLLPADETSNLLIQPLKLNNRKPQNSFSTLSPFRGVRQTTQQHQEASEIEGLTYYQVETDSDCVNLLRIGQLNRNLYLKQRDISGIRSTSLFQLQLHKNLSQTISANKNEVKLDPVATFNFCDLACSNQVTAQEQFDARHLFDIRKLNQSVKAFEKVLLQLCQSKSKQSVPYRESQLTRIMADSLTQETIVIATLADDTQETESTIQFMNQARNGTSNSSQSYQKSKANQPAQQWNRLFTGPINKHPKWQRSTDFGQLMTPLNQHAAVEDEYGHDAIEKCAAHDSLERKSHATVMNSSKKQLPTYPSPNKIYAESSPAKEFSQLQHSSSAAKIQSRNSLLPSQPCTALINARASVHSEAVTGANLRQSQQKENSNIVKLQTPYVDLPINFGLKSNNERSRQRISTTENLIDNFRKSCSESKLKHIQRAKNVVSARADNSTGPKKVLFEVQNDKSSFVGLTSGPHSPDNSSMRVGSDFSGDVEPHRQQRHAMQENLQKLHAQIKVSQRRVKSSKSPQCKNTEVYLEDQPLDKVKRVAEQAKQKVITAAMMAYDSIAMRTEVHRTIYKNSDEVQVSSWKPSDIKLKLKNLFPPETMKDTPRKPLSQIETSESEESDQDEIEAQMAALEQQLIGLNSSGIYLDANSDMHELDESCIQDRQRAAFVGSTNNTKRMATKDQFKAIEQQARQLKNHRMSVGPEEGSKLFEQNVDQMKDVNDSNCTEDRVKLIEQKANQLKNLNISVSSGCMGSQMHTGSHARSGSQGRTGSQSPSQVSYIGLKGMHKGEKTRNRSRVVSAHSNKRTGSRTNSAVSKTIAPLKPRKKKKKRQFSFKTPGTVVVVEPIEVEPRPQQRANDWMTHGNIIGNGMLVAVGQIKASEMEVLREKSKAAQKAREERIRHYYDKVREQRRVIQFKKEELQRKRKEIQMKKQGVVFFNRSRPKSPIEFDMRGLRCSPKRSSNVTTPSVNLSSVADILSPGTTPSFANMKRISGKKIISIKELIEEKLSKENKE